MAEKSVFISKAEYPFFEEVHVNIDWFGGFALSQKRKCQIGLHQNFLMEYPKEKILEISSSSLMSLGAKLSAMHLSKRTLKGITTVESAFQSSRIYSDGIQDMFVNMEEVAEDAYKNTELLLGQYTKVMFRIEKNLANIDYELYAEEGKHLKEMLYELVDFDATAEKRRIQDKLLNNDMNLCLLEIMRDSLIALRDYPKNGQLYYRLLKYRYFESGNTNEDVMLMLDDMPSTTYYRNRKKAIRLYATMLWAFTRPEKTQNKMEEMNWKKSGSKLVADRQ